MGANPFIFFIKLTLNHKQEARPGNFLLYSLALHVRALNEALYTHKLDRDQNKNTQRLSDTLPTHHLSHKHPTHRLMPAKTCKRSRPPPPGQGRSDTSPSIEILNYRPIQDFHPGSSVLSVLQHQSQTNSKVSYWVHQIMSKQRGTAESPTIDQLINQRDPIKSRAPAIQANRPSNHHYRQRQPSLLIESYQNTIPGRLVLLIQAKTCKSLSRAFHSGTA